MQVSGTESPKAMHAKTGIDGPNFSKWKAGQIPRAETVAKFARAYSRPVLEAFIAAGFLTAAEAKERPTAAPSIDSLTDDQLVAEVLRRMKAGERDVYRDPTPIAARNLGRAPSAQDPEQLSDEERAAELGLTVVRPATRRRRGLEPGEKSPDGVTDVTDEG